MIKLSLSIFRFSSLPYHPLYLFGLFLAAFSPVLTLYLTIGDSAVYLTGNYSSITTSIPSVLAALPLPIRVLLSVISFHASYCLVAKIVRHLLIPRAFSQLTFSLLVFPPLLLFRSFPSKELVIFSLSILMISALVSRYWLLSFLFPPLFIVYDRPYTAVLSIFASLILLSLYRFKLNLSRLLLTLITFCLVSLITFPQLFSYLASSLDSAFAYSYSLMVVSGDGGSSARNTTSFGLDNIIISLLYQSPLFTQFLPFANTLYFIANVLSVLLIIVMYAPIVKLILTNKFLALPLVRLQAAALSMCVIALYISTLMFFNYFGGLRLLSGDWLFVCILYVYTVYILYDGRYHLSRHSI
jgi:hypothetical protein